VGEVAAAEGATATGNHLDIAAADEGRKTLIEIFMVL
jgi:hypothetical protein